MPKRAVTILGEALELPAEQQETFVHERCGTDQTLHREVMELLNASRRAEGFLDGDQTPDQNREMAGEPLGSHIDRYKLLQVIGEGGFGTVYMAEQVEPVRRRVALKVVKPGMDTRQVLARFEAERQALAMMDHPNIARVFDGGSTDNGRPYFVMELVRGVPITEFCDANRLSANQRLRIMLDVLGAVQHAHQKGVIHRDLKPSNVLVTLNEGRPVPKVIDFGIAKAISTPLTDKTLFTEYRQMVGTPQYMSPEQAEMSSLDVDTRTDVYSLGVLLYELLTGTPPFSARDLREAGLLEMQRVICHVDPPRPSVRLSTMGKEAQIVAESRSVEPASLSRLMRGDLDWIVMQALEKDRQRRYSTAAELAGDLERYLNREPVLAAPPSPLYRLRKLISRHRVAVAAGLAVMSALALGTVLATTSAIAARRNLDMAQQSEAVAIVERARAEEAATLAEARADENVKLLYAMSLRAAEVAIRDGDIGEAQRILQKTPESQRGWEWPWLNRVAHDGSHVLGQHTADGIRDVEYSPDGRLLVSSGYDNTARVWELHSKTLLYELIGHDDVVTGVSFSPDHERLATCSADGQVKIWSLSNGQEIQTLHGHTSWLSSVAFDPSGRWLASAGGNSNLRLWNARTLELVSELSGYSHDVWSVDFSPDGNRLATCTGDGWVVIWSLPQKQRLWEKKISTFGSWSIRYSPDGKHVVVASFDNRASVWDAERGGHVHDLRGYNLPVRVAEYSPDGQIIVTGGHGTLRCFRADTGESIAQALSGQGDLHAMDFHPSGQTFAVGGSTADVRLWDVSQVAGPLELRGHEELVFEAVTDPTGRSVYSVSQDGSLRGWDALTGAARWTRYIDRGGFYSIDITPDGRHILTSSGDRQLRLWDAASGEVIWARSYGGRARNVRISPDGQFFAAGATPQSAKTDDQRATAAIWDLPGGEQLRTLDGHDEGLTRMDFDAGGTRLATTSYDGSVIIWDVASGRQLQRLEATDVRGRPNSVVFAPDGDRLYVGHNQGDVVVWDLATSTIGQVIAAHNSTIGSVNLSEDGERLLTSAWHNPEVRLWHATTGARLLEIDSGTTGLSDATFLPGDGGLVTAGMEGELKIWELSPPAGAYPMRMSNGLAARDKQLAYRGSRQQLESASKQALALRRQHNYLEAAAVLVDALEQAEHQMDPRDPAIAQVQRELIWTRQAVDISTGSQLPGPDQLHQLAGNYGQVTITSDGVALSVKHDDHSVSQQFVPLDAVTYQSQQLDWIRIRFELDDDQRPKAVIGMYMDGTENTHQRTD